MESIFLPKLIIQICSYYLQMALVRAPFYQFLKILPFSSRQICNILCGRTSSWHSPWPLFTLLFSGIHIVSRNIFTNTFIVLYSPYDFRCVPATFCDSLRWFGAAGHSCIWGRSSGPRSYPSAVPVAHWPAESWNCNTQGECDNEISMLSLLDRPTPVCPIWKKKHDRFQIEKNRASAADEAATERLVLWSDKYDKRVEVSYTKRMGASY